MRITAKMRRLLDTDGLRRVLSVPLGESRPETAAVLGSLPKMIDSQHRTRLSSSHTDSNPVISLLLSNYTLLWGNRFELRFLNRTPITTPVVCFPILVSGAQFGKIRDVARANCQCTYL